ncbi:MAG: M18 family aminopeptidase [Methylotetracoccus sp.]|nr:M18 family aminopeptidase [Methylotetracoccus sp.]
MIITPEQRAGALDLLAFIDASPSPWHAADEMARRLESHGFSRLHETEAWRLQPGARHFVLRGDSSLVALVIGQQPLVSAGFRIVGAHTDSPGLRVKPRAAHIAEGVIRLGVEVYGGPILATFADRDLSLAGRVAVRTTRGFESRLVRFQSPLLRLPNLAIHMNRAVNEDGLKFNKQTELPLLLGTGGEELPPQKLLMSLLAREANCESESILGFELAVYDTQPGACWGAEGEFIADSQLDNLASCHAGLTALTRVSETSATCVGAFFDHEEIGSESAKGADGSLLADVLERIALGSGVDREGYKRALAQSFLVSADMAHAYQPNFPQAYEPQHLVKVNAGPVIKINVNQRYATDSTGEARFVHLCERAGVPYQKYTHRTDLACGSTIGPMTAARLGVTAVDVGNPLWAMHSVRESAGVLDHAYMILALQQFFDEPGTAG